MASGAATRTASELATQVWSQRALEAASLIGNGVERSGDETQFLAIGRRVSVTGARDALSGFQHGRCFYCQEALHDLPVVPHVDHVFAFSLMNTGTWRGPDLSGIWNLVVACAPCNGDKSDRPPTQDELQRLVVRNEVVMTSPHPLKRSLELAIASAGGGPTSAARLEFIKNVDRSTPWSSGR